MVQHLTNANKAVKIVFYMLNEKYLEVNGDFLQNEKSRIETEQPHIS